MVSAPEELDLRGWESGPLWVPGPATFPVRYGQATLERLLPHRPPFLLLDGLCRVDLRQEGLHGQRRIAPEDPALVGHFPGAPVYPETLLLEMMTQLGRCLLQFCSAGSVTGAVRAPVRRVRVRQVPCACFPAAVHAGDGLVVLARRLDAGEGAFRCAGQVLRDERVCALAVIELSEASDAKCARGSPAARPQGCEVRLEAK